MREPDQPADGAPGDDIVDPHVGTPRRARAVRDEGDHRDVLCAQRGDGGHRLRIVARHDRHAVHPRLSQRRHARAQRAGIEGLDAFDRETDAVRQQTRRRRGEQRLDMAKEGIRARRQHHGETVDPLLREVGRGKVAHVAEGLDRGMNAASRFLGHAGAAIHDTIRGRVADARATRDIRQRRRPSVHCSPP
ncbi:hypothetical protein PVT71_26255 (plasmid) [Salipiger sp. H15]|uniref:Uncharacterized protein n=1 Tax=Alloyangia sp. H15 TaxID=3029062 RepID=A0AAU8ARB8_9RHOB